MATAAPQYLNSKQTAVVLRAALKQRFPKTKFRVTTNRGSMVSSVDVRWTDGPTPDRVEEITRAFEDGHFDSMQDMHVSSSGDDRYVVVDGTAWIKGCRYVMTQRTLSPALQRRAAAQVAAYYGLEAPEIREEVWQGTVYGQCVATAEQEAAAWRTTNHHWSTLIYQAASNATRYAVRT